jgi:hypothetical protein
MSFQRPILVFVFALAFTGWAMHAASSQPSPPTQQEVDSWCHAFAPEMVATFSNPQAHWTAKKYGAFLWRNSCVLIQPIAQQDFNASGYLPGCKVLIDFIEGVSKAHSLEDSDEPVAAGMCVGLMKGLVFAQTVAQREKVYCVPPSASTVQVAHVFVEYLEAHPERLHEDALMLVLEAFKNAWPCR